MRGFIFLCVFCLIAPVALYSQVPQARAARDSLARADSTARADSIALVRELEGIQPQPDTAGRTRQQTSTNTRLLPDVSVVGDMIADLSPDGSTQEGGARLGIREVEVAIQAAVDPYFRGDVFLGVSDEEGISIEQAFLTTTALPFSVEARLGRFLMPFGKQNQLHRHDLHTIEHSYVVQDFFSPEGLKGTGVTLSRVFAPLGFYQELQLSFVDRIGERDGSLISPKPPNRDLGGLGYAARLRNYFDVSQAANLEIGASALTSEREQPLLTAIPDNGDPAIEINAYNQRQSVIAADVTYRWRPLQQGIYQSLILQGEVMQQRNPEVTIPENLGPTGNRVGAYAYGRYQMTRRTFVGARYDFVEGAAGNDTNTTAGSGYIEFFPSEFSKLVAGYERLKRGGDNALNRFILQAAFSLGPHKPHPF